MSDYNRTTRECPVSQLRPELRQTIQAYFREHQLGDPEIEALRCIETASQKKESGPLASWLKGEMEATVYTAVLLTSQWLLWARSGERSGQHLAAAKLTDIRAKAFTSVLTRDFGLEISGYMGTTPQRMQGYIGLGAEPAAREFCEAVEQEIAKGTPPKKGWMSMFGG